MNVVKVAFEFPKDNQQVPAIGYLNIKVHMIFDVKITLTRKARLVVGGDMAKLQCQRNHALQA
jgi:hypothetical protein